MYNSNWKYPELKGLEPKKGNKAELELPKQQKGKPKQGQPKTPITTRTHCNKIVNRKDAATRNQLPLTASRT